MEPKETNAFSAPPENGPEDKGQRLRCGGCGRCCGHCCRSLIEYVVIDSFVWPPWPEKKEENRDPEGG